MEPCDADTFIDIQLAIEQPDEQLTACFTAEDSLDYQVGDNTTAASALVTDRPSKVHPRAGLPCVSDQDLAAFNDLMADPTYKNNKLLLNASQRGELLGTLEDPDFRPIWWQPKDRKAITRLSKLRNTAKTLYFPIDRQLYRRWVPRNGGEEVLLRQAFVYDAGNIIVARHKATGHAGEDKTMADINSRYYGISKAQVSLLLKQCVTCVNMASNRTRAPLQPIYVERTLERLQIDMVDMSSIPAGPYKWILHVKDHFSKYSMLYALSTKESAKIADCLQEFVRYYGVPDIIQSDNGREFKGAVTLLCKRFKIKVINGRPRHPQTQGLVEQANGVAKTKINAWMHQNNSKYWPDALSVVESQMNNQQHTSLPRHLTPFRVFNNRRARNIADAQIAAGEEWMELANAVEETSICDVCKIGALPDDASLEMVLAVDLIQNLPCESDDPSKGIASELEANMKIWTEEEVQAAETAAQEQDQEVLSHQERVRDDMARKYSNQHDIQAFKIDQIVTLKLPREDRSDLDDKRLFCKVIEVPTAHRYKLQCQYGIIANLYPTRELNAVHSILQSSILEASNDWPRRELALSAVARSNSTSDRVAIKCSCRGKCAGNKRCQCSKNQQKCTQYCHDSERQCDNAGSILEGTEQVVIVAPSTTNLPVTTRKRARADTGQEVANRSKKSSA